MNSWWSSRSEKKNFTNCLILYLWNSSTWKCLWKAGLGRWCTLNMSFWSPLSSPSSSTSIMESMRESTADSCLSRGNAQYPFSPSLRFSHWFFCWKKHSLRRILTGYELVFCTWRSEFFVVFERRKCKLPEVFHEGQLDVDQTLWGWETHNISLCATRHYKGPGGRI